MSELLKIGLGKLRKKKPEGLILKDGKVGEIDSFFLILALIFNDLKGYVYFDGAINLNRPSDLTQVNGQTGEYVGLKYQVFKLLSSCVLEFMDFMKQNKEKVLKNNRFLLYIRKLSGQDLGIWNFLMDIIFNPIQEHSDTRNEIFKRLLIKIRSNVSYHYYDAGKPLIIGFRNHFYINKNGPADAHNYACYSFNKIDYKSVRFFYADAALASYINQCLSEFGDVNQVTETIVDLSAQILKVIDGLLEQYLKDKASA